MQIFNFIVNGLTEKTTIENYLLSLNVSKVIILKIKRGGISVNGIVKRTIDEVFNGDKITLTLPNEKRDGYYKESAIPLNVIYEDDYFIAVNKPIGTLTHSSLKNTENSIENSFYGKYGNQVFHPVSRLDKDTAGIVIIAKDCLTASFLGNEIASGKVTKKYVATLKGVPNKLEGEINAPIDKSEKGIKRIISNSGKPAITKYKVLKILPNGNSLVEFNLITGRTHQIRVHTAYINCPLYADALYGEKVENETYNLTLSEVSFTHPFTKKQIKITL